MNTEISYVFILIDSLIFLDFSNKSLHLENFQKQKRVKYFSFLYVRYVIFRKLEHQEAAKKIFRINSQVKFFWKIFKRL